MTENKLIITLTEKEKMILNAMRSNEYNDAIEGGPVYAFTVVENSGLSSAIARGVVSSLIKKDFIWFDRDEGEDYYYFTKSGEKLFENASGEECPWGGYPLL